MSNRTVVVVFGFLAAACWLPSPMAADSAVTPPPAAAASQEPAKDPPAATPPPASTPYFLGVLKEGERMPRPPAAPRLMTQEEALKARVASTLEAMRHLGWFSATLLAMIVGAGAFGAVMALLIAVIKRRREATADRRALTGTL